jgi:hypothetical protein
MDVAIRGSGPQENIEAQVDPTFQSLRVTLRPLEWNLPGLAGGGHFFASGASGALSGVGANGPIFSVRWTDTAHYLVLKRLALVYYLTTAYGTAQMNDFDLVRVTGFTASDSAGNAVTPQRKRNANMGSSLVADCRMSSTAVLTAGTRTIDAASVRYVADGPPNVAIPTATLGVPRQELVLYDNKDFAVHPLVLGANEGFLVRMVTAMGASGVIKAYVQAEWAEVAQF